MHRPFPSSRRWPALLLALGALAAFPGCAKKPATHRPQVGVTLLTEAHVFYQDLKRGLLKAGDSLGIDLHVVAGEWDLARQTSQVENFITQKMDAIIIAPVDSRGIVSAVEEANRAGIPVFTVDIAAAGGQVTSHIASDNYQGGMLVGEYLAKLLKGKGSVAVLDQPTLASVIDRVHGFDSALARYPGIHIVANPAVERGLRDVAKNKMDNLLQSHPDLDAVFGSNDDCALGALASVRAAGRNNLLIVGFDATPEARAAISGGGALKADAIQYPETIGRRAIETVYRALHGEQVPSRVAVPVGIVDRDSLAAPAPAH
ncbi:MAG TPA: substrate-binding domain-containing protein [Gemmatimonadales bacterium]|nr:substrate-binding domain-containing protein [Gemmatimonadales bacterium]